MSQTSSQPRSARFGSFEVSFPSRELRKHGVRVKLPGQPFDILAILLERSGDVVTREELRQRLWPADTFVDFENGMNNAVKKLRSALGDSADHPLYIETLPRVGYRFVAPLDQTSGTSNHAHQQLAMRRKVIPFAGIAVLVLATGGYFYLHRAPKLTEKDSIVLADFANTTGDSVFDGTLRQGLSVQLEESPFLSIISDQRIQQTLEMMGQKPDAKLTPEIARELCQRTGSAAVLDGSITQIGTPYLLTLKAVNCSNGESLASTEVQASDKSHVLDALGKTASEIRKKLGESLSTVQKFATPLEQATTPSLEALQAYNQGLTTMVVKVAYAAAVPFFQRAIRLDPNFAMAYAALGSDYSNREQTTLGAENIRKAYELRARASERERFYIESSYYHYVTGDLEKARQVDELFQETYPRYAGTPNLLCVIYNILGQNDKSLAEAREALRLDPGSGLSYANLVEAYMNLNRLDEARATVEEAEAKKLDFFYLHGSLYLLAFLQNDAAGMAQQVVWAAGKPGMEDVLLSFDADTAAYSGGLKKARELSRRAVASAEGADAQERGAAYEAEATLRETLFGNSALARQRAASVGLSTGRDVKYMAALALAFGGDVTRAQTLADDLAKRFPDDTIVKLQYLPTIRGQLALDRNDASKAIEALDVATPFELGSGGGGMYAVYVRGEAYLAAHQGEQAAAEFQKILDHRGIVLNDPIGALAHLQLGRAHALHGDTAKARAAYQDFLRLWTDADPDIPILQAAKAEYAKLQ